MTSTLKIISRRVALTLAVSACFSPVTQAAELLTEGVFKVGMEVTYPPFESMTAITISSVSTRSLPR